jgi:hypothetical protein
MELRTEVKVCVQIFVYQRSICGNNELSDRTSIDNKLVGSLEFKM